MVQAAGQYDDKAVGAQLGIEIDLQPEDRHSGTRKLGATTTSMLQDVLMYRHIARIFNQLLALFAEYPVHQLLGRWARLVAGNHVHVYREWIDA